MNGKNLRKAGKKGDKILKFDDSERRVSDSVQNRLDDGDYTGALRLGYRRLDFFGPSEDAYAMLSDAYELTECNAQALKMWYLFLDICEEDSLGEAYEGLAVNYMNLGKDSQAAYYYNLLLQTDDDISEESKMEIVETFSKPRGSRLRTVYPPEKADYTPEIEKGLEYLKQGNYGEAEKKFSSVDEKAPQYDSAQNLIAVSYLLQDRTEEAKALCEKIIARNPKDVQATTTYAAVLGQTGEKEKAREVAKNLCRIQTKDSDEIYKVATVCCENGLDKEALEKFDELGDEFQNEKTILYFRAVAQSKIGDVEGCLKTLERLITFYPHASVARYYYDVFRLYFSMPNRQELAAPQLNYYYSLPKDVQDNYCDLLHVLSGLSLTEARTVGENPQVRRVLDWAFDETENREEAAACAVEAAIRCDYDDFLRELLLDPDRSDSMKLQILRLLVVRNKDDSYGIVLYHIYRRVKLRKMKIGVKKRKKMLDAYAFVYSQFGILSDSHARRICAASELLYHCLLAAEETNRLDAVNDVAAVIYCLAGIKEGGGTLSAAKGFFGANTENAEIIYHRVMEIAAEAQAEVEAEKAESGEKNPQEKEDLDNEQDGE